MTRRYEGLTDEFDDRLAEIDHYQRYPEMMVAVGAHYGRALLRVLVLEESHYLDEAEPSNTASLWYVQRGPLRPNSVKNITTRSVFDNAIRGRARSKSKMIFYALASALDECRVAPHDAISPLQAIAYMNFFQRPAGRKGKSILVRPEDVAASVQVVDAVVATLQPHLVLFATRLGWRHAHLANVPSRFSSKDVQALCVPHPATSWWNRPSRPMQGKTGRQRLIEVVRTARGAAAAAPRTPLAQTESETEAMAC